MSTSEIIPQLELCAQIMMTPGANVTVNDRQKAEEFFLNFHKTKSPFELCREILETSQNQYVLFQVGVCLKKAIIREWSTLSIPTARTLFSYLFEYVNRRQLDQYVIEELMVVNAIIVKRISLVEHNSSENARTSTTEAVDNNNDDSVVKIMIADLIQIITGPTANVLMMLNACAALKQIMNEHCSLNHSSDYNLSWYLNLIAKKRFEKLFLKDIFKSIVETLFRHGNLPEETRRTTEWIKLCSKLMSLCEMILSWNFNSSFTMIYSAAHFYISRDRIETPNFDPPITWMEFIIDGNLIQFFFEMYVTVRTIDPVLMHSALNCLTQLSTWTATINAIKTRQSITTMRTKFTEALMKNTISLCNMIMDVMSIHEILFVSNLFNSVCINLRIQSLIQHCDYGLVRNFIDMLVKLTCKILLQSVKIKVQFNEEDYDKCNQSIEHLISSVMIIVNLIPHVLSIWSNVNPNVEFISMQELNQWAKPLFETYLRVHLSEPEGLLPLSCFQDDDEVQEFEEDDNTLFKEQLIAIGWVANVDLANAINTVTQLMIMKLQQFEALICAKPTETPDIVLQWTRISEDIHWILMISTYMFTKFCENEIPEEVFKVSINASADIRATQEALESGDFTRTNIDPVVRYFIVIFKLVHLEKQMLENNMNRWISPQVSYTLTCFISRFMHVYLVPTEFDDDEYEISLSLNSCFGADSPHATNMINYFLDHLETKFLTMSSETKVLEQSSEGLKNFCKFRERTRLLRECASLHRLLQRFPLDPNVRKLSSTVRRHMYYVFTTVFANDQDLLIDPLIQLYKAFCEKLSTPGAAEQLQEDFLMIADFVIGISNAVNSSTFNKIWSKFLLPFCNDLPQVLKVMHKQSIVVQAILEILFNFSVYFCAYFHEKDNLAFYDRAVAILNEYASHTKDTFTMDQTRLEETQAEFIWILKFLNDLSAQDIFILFTNPKATSSLTVTIGKVVLTSLNIIMPLINDRMLENERLCLLYYKLLEFISQDTVRFKGFPIKLFENYLKCVEYAFKAKNIPTDIKTIGFKILVELCLQIDTSTQQSMEDVLRPFFQVIIEFIFSDMIHSNDLALRDAVAMALYSLIYCFKDTYRDIIQQVMHFIGEPQTEENVCKALFTMIDEIGFDNHFNLVLRTAIKKGFSEFIMYLQTLFR